MKLADMEKSALEQVEQDLSKEFDALKSEGLSLDMTRGKPAPDQLTLADGMLSLVGPGNTAGEGGTDYRNYGIVEGIPEARRLFADYMGVAPSQIIVGGNASLTMMYDTLAGAVLFGMPGGRGPWSRVGSKDGAAKVICPVPGYDRHFAICERLGLEMVTVPMLEDGPDMDAVEALAADPAVKAIWCVPKYSNPTGAVYSEAVSARLAKMTTGATDFRILWDNAYAVHHLGDGPAEIPDILALCDAAGNPDRVLMFGSTSKITYAGSGVAMMAASEANIADAVKKLSFATIGPDKLNQLRHVRFFENMGGILTHMEKHAAIVKPKFDAVEEALNRRLAEKGIADWTTPQGGYFVSLDVMDDCASEIIRLAGEAGVKCTPAGATFPYNRDPADRNIRIAPTLPSVTEIKKAMEVLCVAVELACARRLLGKNR
ncbi:aminotransferase class I/II-fold pyridoxal phosphate-dependent enzyme [Hwanghaeella sp.]|uniref:aminotransferase class I/II-fold pyridoxal phosphate-dependent enzyme n=1 Tax=Hwanghaeella sp. TaxID=2605943 RepID=UPI003CCB9BE1